MTPAALLQRRLDKCYDRRMSDVIVIVDPEYGELLESSAMRAPRWIVDTLTNREVFTRLWNLAPVPDHRANGAITSFKVTNPQDRMGNLLGILPEIETHHGEIEGNYFIFPQGFVLDVIGLELTEKVESALREFGFTSFVEMAVRFQACK